MTHTSPDQKTEKQEECSGCGNPKPKYIKECPRCGSEKCNQCDMGDDVECGNCVRDGE